MKSNGSEKLRELNDLLFTAFTISSQVWMFGSRESMIEFFCDQLSELGCCKAVVISDKTGEYYRMNENVLSCRYLNYQPKIPSVIRAEYCDCEGVNHSILLMVPYDEKSAVYVFLTAVSEEGLQILKDTASVLGRAIESLETHREKKRAIGQLMENLRQFEMLSDRLRNPLAVIMGLVELEGEIDERKAFRMIGESAVKIKRILDELTDSEVRTIAMLFSENEHND